MVLIQAGYCSRYYVYMHKEQDEIQLFLVSLHQQSEIFEFHVLRLNSCCAYIHEEQSWKVTENIYSTTVLKYNCKVLEYIQLMLLYTSTALLLRGKYSTFHSTIFAI